MPLRTPAPARGLNPLDPLRIAIAIDRVWPAQRPSARPPFHEQGGTWTYLDAHLTADPAARFGVGIPTYDHVARDVAMAMMLVPTTASAGQRVVDAFAARYGMAAPPPVPGTLEPVAVTARIARLDLPTRPEERGWERTQWQLAVEDDARAHGEVWFDFNLAAREGRWEHLGTEDGQLLIPALARALRDGRPPARTPANDPTVAADGPRLVLAPPLHGTLGSRLGSTRTRAIVMTELDGADELDDVDLATGAVHVVYRTKDRLLAGACDATLDGCAVSEAAFEGRNMFGGKPRHARVIWIDRGKVATLIDLPWAAYLIAVSPDAAYVIGGNGSVGATAWERATMHAVTRPFDRNESLTEIIGWRGPVAVVQRQLSASIFGDPGQTDHVLWHVDTGAIEPTRAPPEARRMAPGGVRWIEATDAGIVVHDTGGTSRTLVLDSRDAKTFSRACCIWLDDRYAAAFDGHLRLLDAEAMKVVPMADAPPLEYCELVPGARRAIVTTKAGVVLGRFE